MKEAIHPVVICAVIVTFNPDVADLEQSLVVLRPQVDVLLLVDNASLSSLRDGVRELAKTYTCSLIENPFNAGIADALNQGIRFASEQQVDFVVFFDQDSTVSSNFVDAEVACYHKASESGKVGLVTPTIVKRWDSSKYFPLRLHDGSIVVAQTSGAFMPLSVFHDVGGFNAELFIDYVDYEHCLRMRMKGWQLAYAEAAELNHLPGNGTSVSFLGMSFKKTDASPIRHYYQVRNCLWVAGRYWMLAPRFILRLVLQMVYVHVHAIVFERERLAKLHACFRGMLDAVRNRLGPSSL